MAFTGSATLPLDDLQHGSLVDQLRRFEWRGVSTETGVLRAAHDGAIVEVPTFTNEFWTAKQRAAHSLHEVSYRACFKPQLPEFFISRLTAEGDIVYDPFMGRGTTLVQAALMARVPYGCDVNPLSAALCEPRLHPPACAEVEDMLAGLDIGHADDIPSDLLVFYHPDTLREICALREHLLRKAAAGALTSADRWVRMVAVNRLTGHSPGFFSVYSMPPNQAVSVKSQAKINARRGQTPHYRDVRALVLQKTRDLLRDVTEPLRRDLASRGAAARLVVGMSSDTPAIRSESVALAVTSPPFLDVVNYQADNWLRCWFCGLDAAQVPITQLRRADQWQAFVARTLTEVGRTLKPGGHVAFEVGEVRGGAVRLEDLVIPAGLEAGLDPLAVLYNAQQFTKTANCWGVTNNSKGTNTNRIVVFVRRH